MLARHIECLIFVANPSISFEDIQASLSSMMEVDISDAEIQQAIEEIDQKYQSEDFSFELVEISGGFRFMTKPAYEPTVSAYIKESQRRQLSSAALETLAIIAYKQPVVKSDVEKIRGVNCDYTIQKLLEKEFISVVGRSEAIGKPLIYKTSDKFMDYFGLKDLSDLPKLKDFQQSEQVIGSLGVNDDESE